VATEQPLDYVKLAKDWLPIGLATAYFLGFAIVGIYLAGYGASSLDLIKAQYLAAGLWFCLSFAVYFGALKGLRSLGSNLPSRKHPGFHQPNRVSDLLGSLSANLFIILFVALSLLPVHYFPLDHDKEAARTIFRYVFLWSPFVVSMIVLDSIIQLRNWSRKRWAEAHRAGQPTRPIWLSTWAGTTLYAVIFFLVSILFFAIGAYRTIPFSLGGGRPRQVIFWLGAGDESSKTFLERDGKSEYSVHYELLVESENSLVIVSPKEGQRAIEFDKKSVGAMVVLGKRSMAPANFQRGMTEGTSVR